MGLTATPLREDNRIEELVFLVGPQLFEGKLDGRVKNISFLVLVPRLIFTYSGYGKALVNFKGETNDKL